MAGPTWPQRPKFVQPPSSPSSLFAYGVFLNVTLRYTLSVVCPGQASLLVAGNTCPLPFLSSSGCFGHSWEPFFSFLGVSLGPCVVSGNAVVFSFFSLFSPYPPFLVHSVLTFRRGLCDLFSRGLVPFMRFPFFHRVFPLHTLFSLFFHVSLSRPGVSFLLSFAHTVVRPLVCTHTTYFQPRFQIAMRARALSFAFVYSDTCALVRALSPVS